MMLRSHFLELEAKKPVVILNKDDADDLGVKPLDRVIVSSKGNHMTAIVNVAEKLVKKGLIGLYSGTETKLSVKEGEGVEVSPSSIPKSIEYIRNKLQGKPLSEAEIRSIIDDINENKLSDVEVTSFVVSLNTYGLSMEETAALSKSMTDSGKKLDLGKRIIYDKHSIGGCPGDKTTLILVPLIASAGLTIPKTSSRAITSPAGTADRAEVLCPVKLSLEEMKRVVLKTNGCFVWGGAVDLSPADDIFIQVEYPLSIDPLLLPSVMSKKKAVNANYLVIDIPTGKGTKIKTIGEAHDLANKFIELGKRLGITVECASTYGEQPIGCAVGPALEAREALQILSSNGKNGPADVIDKVLDVSSILFSFAGSKTPYKTAKQFLESGKAYKKLQQIIEEQGGNPSIRPDDIKVGPKSAKVASATAGRVLWISNAGIVGIAREAGTPKDKGAGLYLHKKIGDRVEKGDVLFEIFAEKPYKLERALEFAEKTSVYGIGHTNEMLLDRIPSKEGHQKQFILER